MEQLINGEWVELPTMMNKKLPRKYDEFIKYYKSSMASTGPYIDYFGKLHPDESEVKIQQANKIFEELEAQQKLGK